EPMIGGIQAGRIDDLSARSVFPALLDAARQGGSLMKALGPRRAVVPGPSASVATSGPLFYSLLTGVGSLPVEIARQLEERGVVIRTGVPVTALRRTPSASYPWEVDTASTTTPADSIILATPASAVARFLGALDSALDALSNVRSASAAMITFNVSRNDVTLPGAGTGVLVPLRTPWTEGTMMVTAVTFLDRKWPHLRRSDSVLLRAHVGRSDDVRWSELTDEELTSRVTRELATLLGHFENPREYFVQRWPDGLPQYYLGHENLVTNARSAASAHRVALCGNAYDGVGVPASVGSGRRAASEVLGMLQLSSR
ncbi:MAG: protoporphyrinogen oxidase, partial [Acidimicrobiales bacterium]